MARFHRTVDTKDIAVLRFLDGMRGRFEWVPRERVLRKLPWSTMKVTRSLGDLDRMALIQARNRDEPVLRITGRGLDTLALWELKNHGAIDTVGDLVGKGKEAIVLNATAPDGSWVAVKLHRYYQLEFEDIRSSLAYAAIEWRRQQLDLRHCEIDVPRAKAQVEMTALERCWDAGVSVPRPRGLNRHVVAAEMVTAGEGLPAPPLHRVSLTDPKSTRQVILDDYREAVTRTGIVHGDLSEFNILVHEEGYPVYIDWPQAVPVEYMQASLLLDRDIDIITAYFHREYGLDPEDALVRRARAELEAFIAERQESQGQATGRV